MRLRCPVCHAEAALEAWAEDEAAREMMALLAGLDAELGRPLVAYLGLFRSASRALSWDRALRLAREVLALCPDSARLAAALVVTVEQLRAKRDAGDVRPLTNHNYLKRVLEGVPEGGAVVAVHGRPCSAGQKKPSSATMDAVQRLEHIKRAAREAEA